VDEGAVESELSMYDRARRCGVSVPEVSHRLTNKVHFNGNEYQVLATECIHGNRHPRLDEIVGRYSLLLISNISQLHAERIVHGDIKPANILWDGTTLRIIDFGHSQKIDEARRLVGTVGFTAPDQMDESKANSFASDAYSVGATVKAVLTCVPEDEYEYEEDYSAIESVIQGLMDVKEKRMSLSHAHNLLDKLVNGSILKDIAGAKKSMYEY
jgi:serine/threonine protein kinase